MPKNMPKPSTRIGRAERERAVDLLSLHFQAERLTLAEFEERTTAAFAAVTNTDLHALFHDLPSLAEQLRVRGPARPQSRPRVLARVVAANWYLLLALVVVINILVQTIVHNH